MNDEDLVTYKTGSTPASSVFGTQTTRVDRLLGATEVTVNPDPAGDPGAYRAGLSKWELTTIASNGGVGYLADSTVNNGKGYGVFAVVVPTGSPVSFNGEIGDGTKAQYVVALTDVGVPVPEPMGLAGLGLVGMAALGRRRRA